MNESNTIFARIKRYSSVGATGAKFATKYAGGQLMGKDFFTEEMGRELSAALGGLKGPVMKVAQILATIPNALPEEFAKELSQLQADAPPMGWPFVKRRMNNELGPGWQSRFQSFSKDAAFAASLGQVHLAKGPEDEDLVCKLQYPDMASAVDADLRQLKLIFAIYRRYDSAIDPSEIHQELSERLREELDYGRELKNMRLYEEILRDVEGVHTPVAYEELSSSQLLTMSRLEGRNLLKVVDEHPELRNTIAMNMFKAWYVPLYHYGVIHGDPHLGNYTVRDDGSLNLLDYGCIRLFEPGFVKAIIDLYKALRDDDEDLAVQAYEAWGFTKPNKELLEVLNNWARYLYLPLLDDKVRRITDTEDGSKGAKVAAQTHKDLRKIGGVTPPREFVLVDRAAIGLGSVFMRTRAELNWHRLFHELIDDFDGAALEANQARILEKVGIDKSQLNQPAQES